MKKWIIYILLAVCTATTASAQQQQMRRGPRGEQRPQLTEEQRAKMKEHRKAIQELAEIARAETDPVKKAELVDQLRVKVTEHVEKIQVEFRKRLKNAEQGVEKMKERFADAEKDMDQRIEQHVQDLLDGKKPERPERNRSGERGRPLTAE